MSQVLDVQDETGHWIIDHEANPSEKEAPTHISRVGNRKKKSRKFFDSEVLYKYELLIYMS